MSSILKIDKNKFDKPLKQIKPQFKARRLLTIFDKYIVAGEDHANLEIFDTNLNLVDFHRYGDNAGIREF